MRTRSPELLLGKLEYAALGWIISRRLCVEERSAVVDGLRMPYLECGSGDPVVLIHGFSADKESWFLTLYSMSRDNRVIVPDLPGHGGASVISRGRASARAQSRAVIAFLDLLGIDRVHLVGNSMGGGISLRVARDFPERVRSMVLIDSAGPKPGAPGPEVVPCEMDLALDRGENPLIPHTIAEAEELFEFVAERKAWLPRAITRYLNAQRVADAELLEELFVGWHRGGADGIPQDLEAIETPALVIHGECDRVIDPSTSRNIVARLPNAELLLMPGIGHIPQVEAPRDTARAIDQFVAAHS